MSVEHHAALPYREIAGFIGDLRALDDQGARALELAILCASRTSEVLVAPWSEFDLDNRRWVIPAERMKRKREHRVPLSDAAMAVLAKPQAIRTNEFVFAAKAGNGHANDKTLKNALKALDRGDVTPHGFRSSFTTGPARKHRFRTKSSRLPWRTRSATPPRWRTGAATSLPSGGN